MKTILVADDDPIQRRLYQNAVHRINPAIEVIACSNGADAIGVLEERGVDAVVTDVCMPHLDGIQLVSYILSHVPWIPIVVVTVRSIEELSDRFFEAPGMQTLSKPVKFQVLRETLESLMADNVTPKMAGLSVVSLLRLLAIERRTAVVDLESEGRTGRFLLDQGVIVAAETATRTGEEASQEMLAWTGVKASVMEAEPGSRRPSSRPAERGGLFMEEDRAPPERHGEQPAEASDPAASQRHPSTNPSTGGGLANESSVDPASSKLPDPVATGLRAEPLTANAAWQELVVFGASPHWTLLTSAQGAPSSAGTLDASAVRSWVQGLEEELVSHGGELAVVRTPIGSIMGTPTDGSGSVLWCGVSAEGHVRASMFLTNLRGAPRGESPTMDSAPGPGRVGQSSKGEIMPLASLLESTLQRSTTLSSLLAFCIENDDHAYVYREGEAGVLAVEREIQVARRVTHCLRNPVPSQPSFDSFANRTSLHSAGVAVRYKNGWAFGCLLAARPLTYVWARVHGSTPQGVGWFHLSQLQKDLGAHRLTQTSTLE